MPFDGIVTKAVVEELQKKLQHGRISKIQQPNPTELLFTIRNNRQNHTLLLSVHPSYARFHLTNDRYENPPEAPMFCMILRKYISGAVIESIEQNELERIVMFHLQTIDEIGDKSTKILTIELMGRHSNILLLTENKEKIIDSIKHIPPHQNRYRTILPGYAYKLPPAQNKLNPLTIDSTMFIKRLDFNAGKLDRQIVDNLIGFSPFIAKEIVERASLGSIDIFKEKFEEIQHQILNCVYQPTIYENKKEDFHVIPISHIQGKKQRFTSANEMLDHFYSGKAERDRVKQKTRDLYRFIQNELKKNERKLKIHTQTLKKAEKADHYQKLGELLTAHLHVVNQGDPSVNVVDYYDPKAKEITIPLQTEKSPSENAQIYFTKYRKLVTSKKMVHKEILKTNREINYFEQLLQQIEVASESDIEEIREELINEGYIKKQRSRKKKKKPIPKPEKFISTEGILILVGKNNTQNEYVTHTIANRNDIWLHTKDIPGSHVVIRSNEPGEDTLLEAAQLAAYYSKAQQSASVPIDYTRIRHVKKPRGAKPGFVIYDHQKTLYVTPQKDIIPKLKK